MDEVLDRAVLSGHLIWMWTDGRQASTAWDEGC